MFLLLVEMLDAGRIVLLIHFCTLRKQNMFCFMLRTKTDLEIKEAGTVIVRY